MTNRLLARTCLIYACSLTILLAVPESDLGKKGKANEVTFERHQERLTRYRTLRNSIAEKEEAFRELLNADSEEAEWEAITDWRLARAEELTELRNTGREIADALDSVRQAPVPERKYSSTIPAETRQYLSAKDDLFRKAVVISDVWSDEHAEEFQHLRRLQSVSQEAMAKRGGHEGGVFGDFNHPEMLKFFERIQEERLQLEDDSAHWTADERIAARLRLRRATDAQWQELIQQLEALPEPGASK